MLVSTPTLLLSGRCSHSVRVAGHEILNMKSNSALRHVNGSSRIGVARNEEMARRANALVISGMVRLVIAVAWIIL